MRRRIVWMTVWLTLVFWLGQAWAEATDGHDLPAEPRIDGDASLPGLSFDPVQARRLMDREDWPALVVTPADGRTRHGPTWLTTKRPTAEQMPTLTGRFDAGTLDTTLNRSDAGGYSGSNLAAIGDETVRLLVNVVMLPLKVLVTEPLWQSHTTP